MDAQRTHGNMELGKHAAECVFIWTRCISKLCAAIEHLCCSWQVDLCNKGKKYEELQWVNKEYGWTWIVLKIKRRAFIITDIYHREPKIIYAALGRLTGQVKVASYNHESSHKFSSA